MKLICFCTLFWVFGFPNYSQAQGASADAKSIIVITQPNQNTVWEIPELVSLKWSTINIDSTKSVRFFLVRNEMVVQELGRFKNNGFRDGIELAKNIGSGDTYQVVAIELFPDNKEKIAKFVTPVFSIKNAASDERKRKQELANANPILPKKKKSKSKSKTKIPEELSTPKIENSSSSDYSRQEFEGRKISYIKELEFDSDNITVKIWDHGRQDGDIVSIYLNGNSVVSKHLLTYKKREFEIKLDTNKPNDLFLYAHNLGDAPPNTVSVEITNGKKSDKIILNSDLKSCEAVLISVKK